MFEWIDQARACVLEIMQVSAELTAHLDETICFGWILNVVLRKKTIRNFPLTNKLIILSTRRQLLFRLPFFLFLNNLKLLGNYENKYRMLRKYLVFSKLIRYFLLIEIEQINSLYYLKRINMNCLGSITQTWYQHFCQMYLRMSLSYITIMVIMDHLVYFTMQLS